MISGSAPISKEILEFFRATTSAHFIEGYGPTEATGADSIVYYDDPVSGHVGGPLGNLDLKLVDIPEMEYTSDDKDENGIPMPRGEICYRGPGIFSGYYKD